MADLEMTLDARSVHGKANKRLRRAGLVPAVVFGNREGSTPVQIDAKRFETLYRAAGRTSVITLTIDGDADGRARSAIIKSVQRNPLTGRALHVDFQVIDLTHVMEVDVPLAFFGEAPAVEETGGTLVHNLDRIRVSALPNDMPHEVRVNVSVLTSLDAGIHVRDLSLNRDKVTVLTDGDELVAKVLPPRVEEEPVVEEELEEELAEGEEGAEGEAPTGEAEGEGEAGASGREGGVES
jgi:large subunit ribosomal protein L25